MLFVTATINGNFSIDDYTPEKVTGFQHWYTKVYSNVTKNTHVLEMYYRSDQEVKQIFEKIEAEKRQIERENNHRRVMYLRKILPAHILEHFAKKERYRLNLIENRIRDEERRLHRLQRKENYKAKYGWRHTRNQPRKSKTN
jgi:hypothetical protein